LWDLVKNEIMLGKSLVRILNNYKDGAHGTWWLATLQRPVLSHEKSGSLY
jgi:hypothetical protein